MTFARKLTLTLLTTLLVVWGAWIVGANAALYAAPRMIGKRQPVQLSFRAITIIPTVVHVRDFRLRAEDRWLQWGVDISRATVVVDADALFRRTFRAKKVDASGVGFRLRMKRSPAELAAMPENAYPPISGFGAAPVRDDARFPGGVLLNNPWTLEMANVTAEGDELWVESSRYTGGIAASGQWSMKFDNSVSVGPTQLVFQGGAVEQRGVPVATGLQGALAVGLDRFNPREVVDAAVISQLNVLGTLRAETPENLAATAIARSGAGEVNAAIDIKRGVLQQGTAVHARLPQIAARRGGIAVSGDADVSLRAGRGDSLLWELRGTGVHFAAPAYRHLEIEAPVATVTASSRGRALQSLQLPTVAKLNLPNAKLQKLRALNAFLPRPMGLDIQRGTGRVSAVLSVDMKKASASGTAHVRTDSLVVSHRDRTLKGGLHLKLAVQGLSPTLGQLKLGGSELSFRQMKVIRNGRTSAPWTGSVVVSRASVDVRRKQIFRGHMKAEFADAEPLFRALVEELPVPRWARGVLSPNNVQAEGDFALGRGSVAMNEVNARVGRVNVRSRMRMEGRSQRGVAMLSMGALRVGVERVGTRTMVKPFASSAWYERKEAAAQ